MNPLDANPKIRNVVYTIQWIVSGVLGAIGVVLFVIDPANIPIWYTAATAVVSFAWTYTGLQAKRHTPTSARSDLPSAEV